MTHFAKIVDGIVTNVIVAEPEFFDTFVDNSPGEWLETDHNARLGVGFRKNYAGVGYTYDKELDAFIPPKPSDIAVFDETEYCWKNPPEDVVE